MLRSDCAADLCCLVGHGKERDEQCGRIRMTDLLSCVQCSSGTQPNHGPRMSAVRLENV